MLLHRLIVSLAAGTCGAAMSVSALAFDPFVVKDIRVEGLQRTEAGTVFSYLPVKVGETLTDEKAQQAIRALFATGFFKDVRLEADNGVMVVTVEERPAIAQIDFSGIKSFEVDALRKTLREIGIADGRIFDRASLDNAEQELKRQYLGRGLYAVTVQTTVTPLERNRVGITFTVDEGRVAKIRSINIVGASAFEEKSLLEEMTLRTPGWLTWYTKHDQYSREKLSADLESLRSFYQNRGYLDFAIDSTQVSITPDRTEIYITINVVEGEKYTVSDVKLAGQLLVPEAELRALIRLVPGDVFARDRLVESTKAIVDRLGNDGYAFANANAVPELNKDKRTVAFTILIDPGRRVYVRRISFGGNTRTRDEVIRRESRQLEGAFYDASKIQLSKQRIDRTQYFKDVNVETVPVAGSNDQVDVNFTVEEKPTGAILLGAGLSTTEKFVIQGSVAQTNVFGSGKTISVDVNSGRINKVYSLSYTDPYFTVDGVSRGFDIYHRKTDASSLSVGPYVTSAYGGGMRFGIPLAEKDGLSLGLNAENVKIDTFAESPASYLNFVNSFGSNYSYLAATGGWSRDTRDSFIQTTKGSLYKVYTEASVGKLKYYKLGYQQQYFTPLTRSVTLMLNGDIGIGDGYGGRPMPFFKSYYAGGPGSLRGYAFAGVGPRDSLGNGLGGTRRLTGTAEILFPVPGAEKDKSLRFSTFLDAGQVYAKTEKMSLGELRFAIGIGVNWNSPFGPLRISAAHPINKSADDRVQRLQFTFGSVF